MTLESNLCQEIIRLQRQCSSVESLHVTARSGSPQISIDSKLEYAYDTVMKANWTGSVTIFSSETYKPTSMIMHGGSLRVDCLY